MEPLFHCFINVPREGRWEESKNPPQDPPPKEGGSDQEEEKKDQGSGSS